MPQRRYHRPHAFTLVELLVVVAIVGLLIALLLPAIQSARESSRRTECANHLKSVALATLNYELARGYFPGYRNVQAVDAQGTPQPVGWGFALLPFVEERPIYDAHGPQAADEFRGELPNYTLSLFVCPSDRLADAELAEGNHSLLSYAANAGQPDAAATATVPGDYRANGVFVDRFARDAAGKPMRFESVSAKYIAAGDGLSKTLLFAENADSGSWTDDDEARVGLVWIPVTDAAGAWPASLARINEQMGNAANSVATNSTSASWPTGLACILCGNRLPPRRPPPASLSPQPAAEALADYRRSRPASFHIGGAQAAFADGRVTLLRESLDYLFYCQLLTCRGEQTQIAGSGQATPDIFRTYQNSEVP